MKTILRISFVIVLFCLFALLVQAQDTKYRANDEKSMRIVPYQYEDSYNLEHKSPVKSTNVKYKRAESDDILGKWQFIDTPNTTIEFMSDSVEHTFYFYDGATESESCGEWRESYYDEILIVTLTHLDIDVTEKLAVQVINRKTLALGTIVNGKFDYRYRIKK